MIIFLGSFTKINHKGAGMKIYSINTINFKKNETNYNAQPLKEKTVKTEQTVTENQILSNYYNNHFISFGARVDKGLEQFYERNKERLPKSVETEIFDALTSGKEIPTPIEAHARAFNDVYLSETVDEIKELYPDEPLFQGLKTVKEAKGTRGLIYEINTLSDVLKETGEHLFKDGSDDLTAYLVKKLFAEAKTLKEVNEDLNLDLNEGFSERRIQSSTLKALGIELPDHRYLTSLYFTREGAADAIGNTISKALKEYYEKMSPLDKTSRQSQSGKVMRELTPEEKAIRSQKISDGLKKFWQALTPEEKAERIQKLISNYDDSLYGKYRRYAMINAWNNAPDIRGKMIEYFQTNKISDTKKLTETLPEKLALYQQRLFKEFWISHPEEAEAFGIQITASWNEIKEAVHNGKIDDFCSNIIETQEQHRLMAKSAVIKQTETVVKQNETEPPTEKIPQEIVETTVKNPTIDLLGIRQNWESLATEEQVKLLNDMLKSSDDAVSKKQGLTAIANAWNNSPEIAENMIKFFESKGLHRAERYIYRDPNELTDYQKSLFNEFWQNNPESLKKFGSRLMDSFDEINIAITNGTIDSLSKNIIKKQEEVKSLLREDPKYIKKATSQIEHKPAKTQPIAPKVLNDATTQVNPNAQINPLLSPKSIQEIINNAQNSYTSFPGKTGIPNLSGVLRVNTKNISQSNFLSQFYNSIKKDFDFAPSEFITILDNEVKKCTSEGLKTGNSDPVEILTKAFTNLRVELESLKIAVLAVVKADGRDLDAGLDTVSIELFRKFRKQIPDYMNYKNFIAQIFPQALEIAKEAL